MSNGHAIAPIPRSKCKHIFIVASRISYGGHQEDLYLLSRHEGCDHEMVPAGRNSCFEIIDLEHIYTPYEPIISTAGTSYG